MATTSRPEFDTLLQMMADCTGRTISDRQREFFWSSCKVVDGPKLRQAVNVFASKGHFPTLNELMVECGFVPARTREEQEAAEAKKSKAPKRDLPSTGATPENSWGSWAFEVRKETENEEDARLEFKRIRAERIERAGWLVESEEFFKCREEVSEGRRFKPATIFKMIFHCWKPEPQAPGFVPKPVPKTVRDFKSASAGDLGTWDPEAE